MKKIFYFNWKYLFQAAVVITGFFFIINYPEKLKIAGSHSASKTAVQSKAPANTGKSSNEPILNRSVIPEAVELSVCLDVEDGIAILTKSVFSRHIDFLYCHAQFTSADAPNKVIFRWLHKGQTMEQKEALVSREYLAAWSKKNMSPDLAGDWKVELTTVSGTKLGQVQFTLD